MNRMVVLSHWLKTKSLVKEGSGFIGIAVAVHEDDSVNPLSNSIYGSTNIKSWSGQRM